MTAPRARRGASSRPDSQPAPARARTRATVLALLLACAATLGAGTASADTLVSNLGQGATASAASEVIWSATMTTAHLTGGYTGFGILPGNTREGALTGNEFTFDGETYSIGIIARDPDTDALWLDVRTPPGTCCPDDLRIAGAQWTLYVDDRPFAIKDAVPLTDHHEDFGTYFLGLYSWPDAPDLTVGETVPVEITTTEEDLPFPELSVQGAMVKEVPGTTTTLTFRVSVSPEPAFPVGVHYETEDVTATGGAACSDSPTPDYITTEGRLTFGKDEENHPVNHQ